MKRTWPTRRPQQTWTAASESRPSSARTRSATRAAYADCSIFSYATGGQILEHVRDVVARELLGHRPARALGEIQCASTPDGDLGAIDVKDVPGSRLGCWAALMTMPRGQNSRLVDFADEDRELILGHVMDRVVDDPRPRIEELGVASQLVCLRGQLIVGPCNVDRLGTRLFGPQESLHPDSLVTRAGSFFERTRLATQSEADVAAGIDGVNVQVLHLVLEAHSCPVRPRNVATGGSTIPGHSAPRRGAAPR